MRKVILLLLIFGIIFGGVYSSVEITIGGENYIFNDRDLVNLGGQSSFIYNEEKNQFCTSTYSDQCRNVGDIVEMLDDNQFEYQLVIDSQRTTIPSQTPATYQTTSTQTTTSSSSNVDPNFGMCSDGTNNCYGETQSNNEISLTPAQRLEQLKQEQKEKKDLAAKNLKEAQNNLDACNSIPCSSEEIARYSQIIDLQSRIFVNADNSLKKLNDPNLALQEQRNLEKKQTEIEEEKSLNVAISACSLSSNECTETQKKLLLDKCTVKNKCGALIVEGGILYNSCVKLGSFQTACSKQEVYTSTEQSGVTDNEWLNNFIKNNDGVDFSTSVENVKQTGSQNDKIALQALGYDMGITSSDLSNLNIQTLLLFKKNEKNNHLVVSTLGSMDSSIFETQSVETLKNIMDFGNDALNGRVMNAAINKDSTIDEENNNNKEVEGYKNKPTDNFVTLCSGNLDCLNTVDTLPDENDLRTKFLQKMELGEIRYTEENFVEFLAQENNGLSPKDFQELVDAANTGNCKDSKWGKLICGWLDNIDATELQVKQFGEEIDDILDGIQIKGNVEIGYVNAMVSCAGDTENQCKSKIENECKRITSSQDEQDNCISLGNRALANSAIKNYEGVNEDILNKLFEDYNLCEGKSSTCRSDINSICGTDITSSACNDAIKDLCTDGSAACEAYEDLSRKMRKEGYTETSTAFDVIAALMNPDQNALAASELFGFESDYSDLPQWLTEDTASLICLAKIDGYLDTQVESQFEDGAGNTGSRGITQYGCSLEEGLEFDPNSGTYQPIVGQPCVEVLADLRGERTPILPNNQVQLTYSGYLKAPPNVNISYMLYVSYKIENQSEIELQPLFVHGNGSLDIKTVPAGEDISFYNVVRIPEVGTLKVPLGEEGVKLLLQSFYNDGSTLEEYVSIITPVYPIEAGNYNDPLGQQSSSSGSSATIDDEIISQEEDSIDDGDIMENACQLIGAC